MGTVDYWRDPDLVLGETCSYPYRHHLKDQVHVVGTFDYGLPDCPPGYYRSVVIGRTDDARSSLADHDGALWAINERGSQSGYGALRAFTTTGQERDQNVETVTGSHRGSADAVAAGTVDLCALDIQTWRLKQRYDVITKRLKVIAMTEPTPGLPCICAARLDPEPIRLALWDAVAALSQPAKDLLMLRGVVRINTADYLALDEGLGGCGSG